MEWSSSDNDHGPSPSVPSLQNTTEDVLKRTPSSPDGRDLCSPTEGSPPPTEESPLLKVQFKRAGSSSSLPPATAREIEAGGSDGLRRCNWKNLITTIYLWLTYLIVSAAYSIIGPFFPSEVSHGKVIRTQDTAQFITQNQCAVHIISLPWSSQLLYLFE